MKVIYFLDAYFGGHWLKWMVPLLIGFLLGVWIGRCPAHADELTWEQKKDALMRAYKANGYSMNRYGSIDLKEIVDGQVILPRDPAWLTPARPIQPEKR